eukprot:7977971-Alexandrium_andersonii.AAC.1
MRERVEALHGRAIVVPGAPMPQGTPVAPPKSVSVDIVGPALPWRRGGPLNFVAGAVRRRTGLARPH